MSELSPQATEEVFAQEGGGFLALLTITHADLAEPIRVVDNTVDITSRGQLFIAFPFTIKLPEDASDGVPKAQLEIDNVSRDLTQVIRSISTPPSVSIELVRINDFDDVEVTLPDFQLRNVEWDALTMTGELMIDDIAQEQFPQQSFTPSEYPGLF